MAEPVAPHSIRTVRFHEYGELGEVLHMEVAPMPDQGPKHVRFALYACGLNPANWSLTGTGFFGLPCQHRLALEMGRNAPPRLGNTRRQPRSPVERIGFISNDPDAKDGAGWPGALTDDGRVKPTSRDGLPL